MHPVFAVNMLRSRGSDARIAPGFLWFPHVSAGFR